MEGMKDNLPGEASTDAPGGSQQDDQDEEEECWLQELLSANSNKSRDIDSFLKSFGMEDETVEGKGSAACTEGEEDSKADGKVEDTKNEVNKGEDGSSNDSQSLPFSFKTNESDPSGEIDSSLQPFKKETTIYQVQNKTCPLSGGGQVQNNLGKSSSFAGHSSQLQIPYSYEYGPNKTSDESWRNGQQNYAGTITMSHESAVCGQGGNQTQNSQTLPWQHREVNNEMIQSLLKPHDRKLKSSSNPVQNNSHVLGKKSASYAGPQMQPQKAGQVNMTNQSWESSQNGQQSFLTSFDAGAFRNSLNQANGSLNSQVKVQSVCMAKSASFAGRQNQQMQSQAGQVNINTGNQSWHSCQNGQNVNHSFLKSFDQNASQTSFNQVQNPCVQVQGMAQSASVSSCPSQLINTAQVGQTNVNFGNQSWQSSPNGQHVNPQIQSFLNTYGKKLESSQNLIGNGQNANAHGMHMSASHASHQMQKQSNINEGNQSWQTSQNGQHVNQQLQSFLQQMNIQSGQLNMASQDVNQQVQSFLKSRGLSTSIAQNSFGHGQNTSANFSMANSASVVSYAGQHVQNRSSQNFPNVMAPNAGQQMQNQVGRMNMANQSWQGNVMANLACQTSQPNPAQSQIQAGQSNASPNNMTYQNWNAQEVNAQMQSFLESFDHSAQSNSPSVGSQQMMQPTYTMVFLKQWAQGALNFIKGNNLNNNNNGVASSRYLMAALDVAITLTIHIHNLKTVTEKFDDLLSAGINWANYVSIRLASPPNTQQLNYLEIDSAAIQLPGNLPSNTLVNRNAAENETRAIYYLGLVFYQLFSGGESPAPELIALATCDKAFMSLPRLTLCDNSDDDDDDLTVMRDAKRRQGLASSSRDLSLCETSCEYLRMLGIPGPLCNLIFNMLDCIHGEMSGCECYTKTIDIISDLQLMIGKPAKFLCDLDVNNIRTNDLQMNETIISRSYEFETILARYRKCLSGSCEIAIITGESGCGKSCLAQRVCRLIASEGGICLIGKFDQLNQAIPFGALSSAFEQYCDVLIHQRQTNWAKEVVGKLQAALGRDACYLIQVIPKLSQVLGNYTTSNTISLSSLNSRNAMQRLHYLLCQLVEVISINSRVSVTLFMDDVQWIDEASLSFLSQLLRRPNRKFFFLGCSRNDKTVGLSFWKLIEKVRSFGINSSEIKLNSIEEDALNKLISDTLCLPPRLVKSLSAIIHNKTKGNILFVSQLIKSFCRDGLLHLDFDRRRWIWDEERILASKLPDNMVACFTESIGRLPSEVQSALNTLSMLGASTISEYIKVLESKMGLMLIGPLKIAASQGLVIDLKGFSFCHDRIQEASYNLLEEQERNRTHLKYGKCLMKHSLDTDDNDLKFMGITQINLGGPSAVSDPEDYFAMAQYNMMCGKISMSMSNFSSAYSLFNNGIAFLRENHWKHHYQFSLEIFELTSRSALATGNLQELNIISDQVLKNARTFEDKLNTYSIIMTSLAYTHKIAGALDTSLAILSKLKEDLPTDLSKENFDQQLHNVLSILGDASEDFVLNYKTMTDTNKLAAMRFLSQIHLFAMLVKPMLHPFVILKMMHLTISHGLSPSSPIGFACFGNLLAKQQGNFRLGHKFALLSKALISKLDTKEIAGEVMCCVAEVQSYVEPLQSTHELQIQGEAASISAGDIHFACWNRFRYCSSLLHAGVNLQKLKDTISKACQFMKEQEHMSSLALMSLVHRNVLILTGNEVEPITRNNMNHLELLTLSFQDLFLSLIMSKNDLKRCCEAFFKLEATNSPVLMFSDAVKVFISGLASFQVYRETNNSSWADKGRKTIKDMKLWVEQGSEWNFLHKLQLLKAEAYYCDGNHERAKESYKSAITSAREHKFVNDEALACELAARYYSDTNDPTSSLEHFILAHEKYQEWGAVEKANILFTFVNEKFAYSLAGNS